MSLLIAGLVTLTPSAALCADNYEAAVRLAAGDAGPASPANSVVFLKKACESGEARDCRELGAALFFGDGVDLNVFKAAGAYQRGCDHGDAPSCIMLAKMARRGFAAPSDTGRADKLLSRVCEVGSPYDCGRAAMMYSKQSHFLHLGSVSAGFENDDMLATLVLVACKRGNLSACGRDDSALRGRVEEAKVGCANGKADECILAARAHEHGQYAEQSRSKAADLFDLACQAGSADGCYAADVARAGENDRHVDMVALATRHCLRGVASACSTAGGFYVDQYASKENQAKALSLLRRGCIADDPLSCVRLADYIRMHRLKAPYNPLYERACWLGDEEGCNLVKALNGVMDGLRYSQTCKAADAGACAKGGVLFQGDYRTLEKFGLFYPDYGGVKEDRAQAVALFRTGCEKKNGASCGLLGVAQYEGDKVTEDLSKANGLFSKGCELSDGFSCTMLAFFFDSGTGVETNVAKAMSLAERGCELGAGLGCRLAGMKYLKGNGVDQDSSMAAALLNRGCELKDDACCSEHRSFTSDAQVFARVKHECNEGKLGSCFTVGERYRDGVGVDRNRGEAISIFKRICDLESEGARDDIYSREGAACYYLVALKEGADFRNPESGDKALLERSCAKRFGLACWITRCQGGDAESCAETGDAFRNGSFAVKSVSTDISKDQRLAEAFYDWGCDQSRGDVCFAIGEMYRTGTARHDWVSGFDERKKNLPLAVKMYDIGCEKGHPKACSAAGDQYRSGTGVPVLPERAKDCYKKACDLGLGDACVGLKLLR